MHLLIAHNEYGRPSGEERAVAAIEAMLVARGHRVSRFQRSSAEIGESAAQKLKAAAAGVHNPFEHRRMERALADLEPDVVLVQNLYPWLSPSILRACRARGVPVVMRCCNYRLFCPSGLHLSAGAVCERCLGPGREIWCALKNCEGSFAKSAGYALRGAAARLGRRIVNRVDAFIVLTEFQRQRFASLGIPASQLTVIPNCAEAGPLPAPAGSLVTFVGRVAPEKGIADFLAMARRLPDVPFAVAGAVKAGSEPLLRESPANVRWLGHLARPALEAVLADSRVVAVCSQWYEGFPNVALEAMAAGRAVLATSIGGLPEIVEDGRTGLLYPPGDIDAAVSALRRLYDDPARCAAFGAAGHAKVRERYNPARAYAAYMDVFSRVQTPPLESPALETDCESCAVSLQ